MSDLKELAITSDSNGSLWTCSIWDPRALTHIMQYKGGGASTHHALSIIDNKFIISANSTKSLIHIWALNKQEKIDGVRFITPDRITAFSVSPSGQFLIGGAGENVYIWQIASGKMIAVLSRHYQQVTTIKFTDDGSHFVTAGNDGMVLVWNLSYVLEQRQDNKHCNPLYTFSDHVLPVNDVHVGKGGLKAFIATVSLDRTCRIYDLWSGRMMLLLVFPESLTSVVIDNLETTVYIGTTTGQIHTFNINNPPRMKEYHVQLKNQELKDSSFVGHTDAVTCLSISMGGDLLLSGSKDESVIIWHIESKKILRKMVHKGPITNAFFMLTSDAIFNQEIELNFLTKHFHKVVEQSYNEDNEYTIDVLQTNIIKNQNINKSNKQQVNNLQINDRNSNSNEHLKNEIKKLQNINKELYMYCINNIIQKKN